MRASPFNDLLTGPLSSRVVWEQGFRCPCVQPDGGKDRKCVICGGIGRYWGAPSTEFRCGVTSLSAKALAAIQQKFGPGTIGDSQASIPGNAPCWALLGEGDRFTVLDAQDRLEWTLSPGNPVKLPYQAVLLAARIRTAPALTTITDLVPGTPAWTAVISVNAQNQVSVTVPTVIAFTAPRRFEVVRDLSQVRAFVTAIPTFPAPAGVTGLPKKVLLRLIDWTVR